MFLFRTQRFLPLFLTQFLGALNDNLLKNALIMLVTYHVATAAGSNAQMLVTLAAGLFILPFFLFSATAGQVADKFDRAYLTRIIKTVEIAIMAVASIGFSTQSISLLLLALFGMGVHSTFFGPIKYALLPQHLREEELVSGNAYIEAGTFLSILLGTILGGVLVLQTHGEAAVSIALVAVAVSGYATSRRIPVAVAAAPALRINWNIWQETSRIISYSRSDKQIFLCILGISWFWFVGATLLAEFAPFVKDVLHSNPAVATLLLTTFSIGSGIGSLLCNKLLRGYIQATYVPLASLAISLFGIDLFFASHHFHESSNGLFSFGQFITTLGGLRIIADLLIMAICGGVYIVPLYAILQHRSPPEHRARIIAANNVVNALFMVASALLTLVLIALSFTIPAIFLTIAVLNFGVAFYICKLLPDALVRGTLRSLLTFLFRVEVKGMEHYAKAGDRVLIIANHTSFLDAILIASYLPEKLHFAVNTHIAKKWWMKPALMLVNAFPLDPLNPLATKSLIDLVKQNKKCMVFPEGRLTVTGSLMKIYEGPGLIADKSGAQLLPIRIDGAQYSKFSRLKGKVRLRWFPKITLTILPHQHFNISDDIKGRARRRLASAQLYDVMSDMMFDSTDINKTLFSALITASEIHGKHHLIAEDVARKPLSYGQFMLRAFALGRILSRMFASQPILGVMLPNTNVTAVTFFALQAFGKTPAMINFSGGSAQILQACQTARLQTILTAKRFVKTAKLDSVITDLTASGINITYLEDIATTAHLSDKLFGLLSSRFPHLAYHFTGKSAHPDTPAVILYTSGSESAPKGVVLSHKNILANCSQLASRVDFGPQDKVLNILPMFHSFGLTGGTLLPLFSGIKIFFYPSPLHYRIVPELIYDTNSTIMFGTDTFLSAYARFAHPYDLNSVRYIFAGAEKLREETRRVYADKYGVRIFEGYGATEMSPVISMNTPMQNRPGTVGRLLPGLDYHLDVVSGIEDGAQLTIKGPNVMLGYMKLDQPGVLQQPVDGWYDTGDIVAIDPEGYITIKGRQKRFAKIGGEMVSLSAVEANVSTLWKDHKHAIVSIPDTRKGEQIILLTEYADATREELVGHLRAKKMAEIAIPRRVLKVAALPMLGTGKADYQKVKAIAIAEIELV